MRDVRMREVSANTAVVLGVLSMFLGVFGPFAVRAGLRSLRNIQRSRGILTGTASALFGIIAGVVSTLFLLIGLAWFVVTGIL